MWYPRRKKMDIRQYFKSKGLSFEDTLPKSVPKARIQAVEKERKEQAEAVPKIRSGGYIKV